MTINDQFRWPLRTRSIQGWRSWAALALVWSAVVGCGPLADTPSTVQSASEATVVVPPGTGQSVQPPPGTSPEGGAAPTAPTDAGPAPGPEIDDQPAPGAGGGQAGGQAGDQAADGGDGQAAPPPAPPPATSMALPADGPVGAACRGYLRPTIPRLVIEVDAQDGTGLSPAVIDHLVGALAGVVDKPAGIEVQSGTISDPSRGPWTLDAVRTLAAASRTVPQDDQTAVMHVLVLRGEPDQSDPRIADAIGVAFNATEFVVFADRVDSLALLLGGADAVLRAVVTHEAGHLLCLVNISYASDLDHEDPDHPGHSADTNSVMFHAIETTAISQLFSGPPPATFSAADSADLEGLRTGRY